jgi:hypothetical protein
MSFKMPSMPTPPPPSAPPPPPNPPLFGSRATKGTGRYQERQGFGGTVLGNVNPANTGQKTLLGQ